jgi:hypothetical protein
LLKALVARRVTGREVAEDGLIQRRQVGKYAEYRVLPPSTFETGYDPTTGEVLCRRAVYS